MNKKLNKAKEIDERNKLIISTLSIGAVALIILGICYINIVKR